MNILETDTHLDDHFNRSSDQLMLIHVTNQLTDVPIFLKAIVFSCIRYHKFFTKKNLNLIYMLNFFCVSCII